ncbi:MAG: hypothetical protein U0V87_08585 [Acidobacteriota bacterium]
MKTTWLLALSCCLMGGNASAASPADLRTVAEKSEWTATSNYDQTLAYLRELCRRQPAFDLTSFGVSPQGRDLPLLIVSRERAFTPKAARALRKPIVLIKPESTQARSTARMRCCRSCARWRLDVPTPGSMRQLCW